MFTDLLVEGEAGWANAKESDMSQGKKRGASNGIIDTRDDSKLSTCRIAILRLHCSIKTTTWESKDG